MGASGRQYLHPEPRQDYTPIHGPMVGVVWATLPVLLLIVIGVVITLVMHWPWGAR